MVYTVERIPIFTVVALFVIYILIHLLIAVTKNKCEKQIKDGDDRPEMQNKFKWLNRADKWFPAIYVIFVIAMFYF